MDMCLMYAHTRTHALQVFKVGARRCPPVRLAKKMHRKTKERLRQ
jgi:hypothetical protein